MAKEGYREGREEENKDVVFDKVKPLLGRNEYENDPVSVTLPRKTFVHIDKDESITVKANDLPTHEKQKR